MSLTTTVSRTAKVNGKKIQSVVSESMGSLNEIFAGSSNSVDLSKLAPSIMTAGSESKAAVVDIYKGSLNSPQNKITSILSGAMKGLEKFTGGLLNSKSLNAIQATARTYDTLKKVNWDDVGNGLKNQLLTGIVAQSSPIINQTLGKCGFTVETTGFIKGLAGLPGGIDLGEALKDNPKFKALYDGVEFLVKDADYSSVDGMFKVLSNLSGNSALAGLLNMQSTFALLGVITETALLFDTPKLFEKINNYFKKDDERRQYIIENIAMAAYSTNLAFFEYAMKHISRNNILSNHPTIMEDLLANFTFIDEQVPSVDLANRLIKVLNWLRPSWDKIKFGDRVISNLELFTNMSASATELLRLTDEYRDAILIAGSYRSESLVSMLQKAYPRVPIRRSVMTA